MFILIGELEHGYFKAKNSRNIQSSLSLLLVNSLASTSSADAQFIKPVYSFFTSRAAFISTPLNLSDIISYPHAPGHPPLPSIPASPLPLNHTQTSQCLPTTRFAPKIPPLYSSLCSPHSPPPSSVISNPPNLTGYTGSSPRNLNIISTRIWYYRSKMKDCVRL